MSRCRFCLRKPPHILDDHAYCCAHFDEIVEHGATLMLRRIPRKPRDPWLLQALFRLAI